MVFSRASSNAGKSITMMRRSLFIRDNMAFNDSLAASDRMPERRERIAVLVLDVVESVRLMQADESGQIDRWRRLVDDIASRILPLQRGRLVKSLGDGLLLEFATVGDAVRAALDIHDSPFCGRRAGPPGAPMMLRIGIHVCEIVRDALDIYGNGVNLAARLAGLAGPGEIVTSASARDELQHGLDADIHDLGDCYLKHYDGYVRAYRIGAPGPAPLIPDGHEGLRLQPGVAVIPFDTTAADPGHRIAGELIADGVISQLALTPELLVISRLSCRAFAGHRSADPATIGAHLKASYAVSGSVFVQGDRLLVCVELCETQGGSVLWTDRMTGATSDLLDIDNALVDRLAQGVHHAILDREVRRARIQPLPSLESHALLLGAVNLMHRQSPAEFDRAHNLLEHLSERHAFNATPRAWLAKWYALHVAQHLGSPGTDGRGRARRHVDLALTYEPTHALAWSIKGLLDGYVDGDFDAAGASYDAALRNNPNESLAWLYRAALMGWQGHADEAADAGERALRLSPLDPIRYYYDSLAGAAMLGARRYERAIELSRRSLQQNRMHLSTYRVLAMAQALSGDVVGARLTVAELLGMDPSFNVSAFRRVSPWRISPDIALLVTALHEAGVPAD